MVTSESSEIHQTIDHLFRTEAGKMVVVLTRLFGFSNIEQAEDIVQDVILKALNTWKYGKIPEDPTAWLYRASKNAAIDLIRRNQLKFKIDHELAIFLNSEYTLVPSVNELFESEKIRDSQLRMMYACCHPDISEENQITLILKTICGFNTSAIARSFLVDQDTVSKRLYRTKEFFRKHSIQLVLPKKDEIRSRTSAVLNTLYLLFNEGYNSKNPEELVRIEIMQEAMTLCKLIIENKLTNTAESNALMALMCFQAARIEGRLTVENEIILLPDQDRSKWDDELIIRGSHYLSEASQGEVISTYHLEAAIAFEHCNSVDFKSTNWQLIVDYYDTLCHISPSPIFMLNRVIALMHLSGAQYAFDTLQAIADKRKLEKYYLYYSVQGELYLQLDQSSNAVISFKKAKLLTDSNTEKKLLESKIKDIEQN